MPLHVHLSLHLKLPIVPAGVVASDLAKMHAACPSLAYWLRATVMAPISMALMLVVRRVWAGWLARPPSRLPVCWPARALLIPTFPKLVPHSF